MYTVYVIGDSSDICAKKYDNCYVGVTNNPHRRWKNHEKSGYKVCEAIAQNNWCFADNMAIIFEGSAEECFAMETTMRPYSNIGLNEAAGGKGGHTSYTDSRSQKISKSNSGRKFSDEHKLNISKIRIENKICAGERNPRAKSWLLISPTGEKYMVTGGLQQFCKSHNICWTALRKNIGAVVGEISPKFRNNGDDANRIKRNNTIGWTLMIQEK